MLSTLDILPNTHQIDDKTRNYLTPPKLSLTPLFYSLRKVHKLNIPLCLKHQHVRSPPINYFTHFIQPLVEILSSYLQESKHYIQVLDSDPPLPENTILVCATVTSFYTNMPHEEGIESVLLYMRIHPNTLPLGSPSPDIISILLEIILKNNHLSFLDRNVLKPIVSATGTSATPSYTKLFEGCLKKTVWEAFIGAINLFGRY